MNPKKFIENRIRGWLPTLSVVLALKSDSGRVGHGKLSKRFLKALKDFVPPSKLSTGLLVID